MFEPRAPTGTAVLVGGPRDGLRVSDIYLSKRMRVPEGEYVYGREIGDNVFAYEWAGETNAT